MKYGIVLVSLLVGCGESPLAACEQYVEAWNRCNVELGEALGEEPFLVSVDDLCSRHERGRNSTAEKDIAHYKCMIEVYDRADCSTVEDQAEAIRKTDDDCLWGVVE